MAMNKTGGFTGRPMQKGFSGGEAKPATPPKTTGTLTPVSTPPTTTTPQNSGNGNDSQGGNSNSRK